jgi:hypothetical protein
MTFEEPTYPVFTEWRWFLPNPLSFEMGCHRTYHIKTRGKSSVILIKAKPDQRPFLALG